MADVKSIAETLVNLTVKDVQELAKILKDDYGIEPAAAAVVVSGGGAAGVSGVQLSSSLRLCDDDGYFDHPCWLSGQFSQSGTLLPRCGYLFGRE